MESQSLWLWSSFNPSDRRGITRLPLLLLLISASEGLGPQQANSETPVLDRRLQTGVPVRRSVYAENRQPIDSNGPQVFDLVSILTSFRFRDTFCSDSLSVSVFCLSFS